MTDHLKMRIIKKEITSRYWVQEKRLFWWLTHENDGFNTELEAEVYIRNIAKNIYDAIHEKDIVCKEYLISGGIVL